MTVKDKVGRKRYVAFSVDEKMTREELISSLRRVSGDPPYVVQCAEGWAIVRCGHDKVDDTIDSVKRADPLSSSLRTSGTLAALRRRYSELKRLRPLRRKV
ncbi:MAG: hypothetical protein FWD37_00640 [Methanomassiliicoccaceae archaeon]|nr:hypothetical protein [Methanomassiliicoccaceae archaeon]